MTEETNAGPWFLYLLSDPLSGEVKKVGIARDTEKRLRALFASAKHRYNRHHSWFLDMRAKGVRPRLIVVAKFRTKKTALRYERIVSASLRIAGVPIVNGEGESLAKKVTA